MSKSFFDFFPTPKFLEMPAPGLALTDSGLKFIEFGTEKGITVIRRYASSPLPKGLIEAGAIIDQEALIKALENFRKSWGLKYIRTSLPEERAYLFQTLVPKVADSELKTAVESTIEENVPLSVSEIIFDYSVLPRDESIPEESLAVSVSVIPEVLVLEYLTVFRAAGFMPLHFDIESQAVQKAVIGKGETETSLIINLNKTKAGLYIVSQNAVTFTSTIAVDAPQESAKKDPLETGEPVPMTDEETVLQYPSLKMLVTEIQKVFLYWQTQADRQNRKIEPIEKIVLCGEEAGRDGVAHYFAHALSTKVELANVWRNTLSFDQYIPDIKLEDSLSYAAAAGLAITHDVTS